MRIVWQANNENYLTRFNSPFDKRITNLKSDLFCLFSSTVFPHDVPAQFVNRSTLRKIFTHKDWACTSCLKTCMPTTFTRRATKMRTKLDSKISIQLLRTCLVDRIVLVLALVDDIIVVVNARLISYSPAFVFVLELWNVWCSRALLSHDWYSMVLRVREILWTFVFELVESMQQWVPWQI